MLGTVLSMGYTATNKTANPCLYVSSHFSGGRPLINKISKIYSLPDREMLYGKVKQEGRIEMGKVVILSQVIEKASYRSENQ